MIGMPKPRKPSRLTYLQFIALLLSVCMLVLYIPIYALLYRSATRTTLDTTTAANLNVLHQMEYSFECSANVTNSLCLSIWGRNDVQQLLFSWFYEDELSTSVRRTLTETILASNPSIHSILIYNRNQRKTFSVTSGVPFSAQKFHEAILARPEVPSMTPLLLEIPGAHPDREPEYVVSTFLHWNEPDDIKNTSYLVINQYAEEALWPINPENYQSRAVTYLLSNDITLSGVLPDDQDQDLHPRLLEEFRKALPRLDDAGYRTQSVDGVRYLLTYIKSSFKNTTLLMIQPYDVVFAGTAAMGHQFLLIFACMLLFAALLVHFFSHRLYSPVQKTLNDLSQTIGTPAAKQNEMEYLKSIYQNASQQIEALSKTTYLYKPMALRYNLYRLMLRSDEQNIANFRRVLVNHWLASYEGPLRVMLIKPLSKSMDPEDMSDDTLFYAIQNISEELLSENFRCVSFRHSNEALGIVVGCRENQNAISLELVSDTAEAIREALEQHFSVSPSIAISSVCQALSQLSGCFREALNLLSYTYVFGPTVLTSQLCSINVQNATTSYAPELEQQLQTAIQARNMEQIRKALSDIASSLATLNSAYTLSDVGMLLISIHQCVLSVSDTSNVSLSILFNQAYHKVMAAPYLALSFQEIQTYLEQALLSSREELPATDTHFVTTVVELIHQQYANPALCSQSIADELGISDRSLLQKFKKLTGQSLNDYLVSFRMKKAAGLLSTSQLPVSEVAAQVGIDNISYFYKLFKKSYGMTPRQFTSNQAPPEQ